jgi:hypothetical protein
MSDSCKPQAKDLGFNSADVKVLIDEIAKKESMFGKAREHGIEKDRLKKLVDDKNSLIKVLEKKNLNNKVAVNLERVEEDKDFDKAILDKRAEISAKDKDLQDAKDNLIAKKSEAKSKGEMVGDMTQAKDKGIIKVREDIKSMKDEIEAINKRKKMSKDERTSFDKKNMEPINKLKMERSELKELKKNHGIAERLFKKFFNDGTLGLKNAYKDHANNYVKRNYQSIIRRNFRDKLVKNPALLQDMFINDGRSSRHGLHAKLQLERGDFKVYSNEYVKENLEHLSEDRDMNNMDDKHIKGFIDNTRDYINTKHFSVTGKKYFEDDLQHVISINGDNMRANLDDFIDDVKSSTDPKKLNEMFNEQSKLHDSGYEDIEVDTSVGAERKSLKEKTIDEHFKQFKTDFQAGDPTSISLGMLPFKSNKAYESLNRKYSDYSIIQGYQNFVHDSFLSSNIMNREVGGHLDVRRLPKGVLTNKFDANTAQAYVDYFKGGYTGHSDLTNKILGVVSKSKSIVMMSHAVKLPLYSAADESTGSALESLSNSRLNLFNDTFGFFKELVNGLESNLVNYVKINGAGLLSVAKINQKQVMNSVLDVVKGMNEYNNIRYLEEGSKNNGNGLFKWIDKFNNKFTYNAMHSMDDMMRQGRWAGINRHFHNYREDAPVRFHERLENLGFRKDQILRVREYVEKSPSKTIKIDDFKDDKNLMKNLRMLKYSTDLNAVPLDVTPLPLMKLNGIPVAKSVLSMFWSFHLKALAMTVRAYKREETTSGKISAAAFYMIKSLPTNLATTALMNLLYTGENPFNEKNWKSTLYGSLAGSISRPASIYIAMLTQDRSTIGGAMSNPLLTTGSHAIIGVEKLGATSLDYMSSNIYDQTKDQKKAIDQLTKVAMGIIPFGGIISDAANLMGTEKA